MSNVQGPTPPPSRRKSARLARPASSDDNHDQDDHDHDNHDQNHHDAVSNAKYDTDRTLDLIRALLEAIDRKERRLYDQQWGFLQYKFRHYYRLARLDTEAQRTDDGPELFPVWLSRRLSPEYLSKLLKRLESCNPAGPGLQSSQNLQRRVAEAAGIPSISFVILCFGNWVANCKAALK